MLVGTIALFRMFLHQKNACEWVTVQTPFNRNRRNHRSSSKRLWSLSWRNAGPNLWAFVFSHHRSIWDRHSFWLECVAETSLAPPAMSGNLEIVSRNFAGAICNADAPSPANTALYPHSSLTLSPQSTSRPLYSWRFCASSVFCKISPPGLRSEFISLPFFALWALGLTFLSLLIESTASRAHSVTYR